MAVVELPVVRFEQKPGRCGAATAQMILFYKNLIGNQPGDQDTLWAYIQASTGGARPLSPPANVRLTDCPTWSAQQCDQCQGAEEFVCWCTFPPALLKTLTDFTLPMAMSTPATDQAATALAIASVDFNIPAAMLAFFGLHWLAVAGYETDGANAQPIGGRQISEIYVRDPEVNAANHSVAIDVWMDEYVSPVNQCGAFLNQLVVIAATGPLAPSGGSTNGGVGGRPHKKKRPRKPRPHVHRPRRPPKPPRPPKKRRRG